MAQLRQDGPEAILDIMDTYNFNPKGILHIGANAGWEYLAYSKTSAQLVIYIEPIPRIYEKLCANIESLKGHIGIMELCGESDGLDVEFGVSSNDGLSSSIFPLGNHLKIHPEITYTEKLPLRTKTLNTIIKENNLDKPALDYLVLDVQGAELFLLRGAADILPHIQYLVCESSDFPLYEGGCTLSEIHSYLTNHGFRLQKDAMHGEPGRRVGDVLFVNEKY